MKNEYNDFQMLSNEQIEKMKNEYFRALDSSDDAIKLDIFESLSFCIYLCSQIDKLLYFGQLKITLYKIKKCLHKALLKLEPSQQNLSAHYFKVKDIKTSVKVLEKELLSIAKKLASCENFKDILDVSFQCLQQLIDVN